MVAAAPDRTQWHTPLGRTTLEEGSARRRDLYLTTHNSQKRKTSMPPAGFEPEIPASERPQIHAWDLTAAGIIAFFYCDSQFVSSVYLIA